MKDMPKCKHGMVTGPLFSRSYDREGKPMCCLLAAPMTEEYRRVALTKNPKLMISTVWLGIDHGFRRSEKPIIFETMIFRTDEDEEKGHNYQERYCTEAEVIEGHQRIYKEFLNR